MFLRLIFSLLVFALGAGLRARADTADVARDHWSFKPLQTSSLGSIDAFVDAKLAENKLQRLVPASPEIWLRRVTFDLTGLPPTPAEMADFLREPNYAAAVDRLLQSERYGEHWAQHWLDVVRYADTHGFEVNTERPHAWPYRDYVIRSFNQDTPYDRFIKEQLAGDAMGKDAATGFLVTASVLLPGQIGKDAPSIRLARQDSLDEIVNNIGQTFLGLSVGCARCHDHKFDPITSRDYYAMQAFVAGVEYEDRELRTPETDTLRQEGLALRQQIKHIEDQLAQFIPLAQPGGSRRGTNTKENVENFPPMEARYVRFTIHDANLHPSLGLIEPCIDEFEIFTTDDPPRNVALASCGTKVTASGSRVSESHKLEHINDGQPGNDRSWMSDTNGRGWVQFELPQNASINRMVWSRDRLGKFSDRLATSYTLEAGLTADKLTTLASVRSLRPTIQAQSVNVDRFQPVRTSKLRFTITETNSLEPCIDELEVFNSAGQNIALASRGAKVRTSGDTIVAGRHEPTFINDGKLGNEHSWMSNEPGKGWVELEFPNTEEINRVQWSRDREGKHEDRLAVGYRIEVMTSDGWKLVADSTDRSPQNAPDVGFTTAGLPAAEADKANELLAEKTKLQVKVKAAEVGQLAFAGKFRVPDEIHLLNRGDPEQPQEIVVPAVLSFLGDRKLEPSTPEQQRRLALAEWIASPQNSLTARVMVNRIWQGHFGTGLVATPSDFGRHGMPPSHPELLDWLAAEFVRNGWSVKHLHRLIVLSETYRQSAAFAAAATEKDADVRWLWRFPTRRLEAESIRDSMLAISGQLNLQMYGSGFNLFDQRGGLSGFKPVETLTPGNQRRMIYAHKVRRESEAVFGAFDCPDAGQSTAARRASTTPIQALNLFNSSFTLQVSDALAARLSIEAGADVLAQITKAYQLTLCRAPTAEELQEAEPVVRHHGLATFCRVLFNSNEFLFVP